MRKTIKYGDIIVINSYSSGEMYIQEALDRGFGCILLNVLTQNSEVNKYVRAKTNQAIKQYSNQNFRAYAIEDDSKKILELLSDRNIVAVCPGGDSGVALADKLCSKLGLRGNNPDTSKLRLTKSHMMDSCKRAGLRSIITSTVNNHKEISDFFEKNNIGSAFMKYDFGASGQGSKRVNNVEEAIAHFEKIKKEENSFAQSNVDILMQEYIDGKEYVINTVSVNGKHCLTDLWVYTKFDDGEGHIVYNSCDLINEINDENKQIIDYTFKVLDCVDFKYGVAHNEVKLDSNGPVLIEVNPRPMGGGQTRDYLKKTLGHCIVDLGLDSFLGDEKICNDLYPFSEYKPLLYSRTKLGVLYNDTTGYLDSGAAISGCLPTCLSNFFFLSLGLHSHPKTINLEEAPYAVKLSSESLRNVNLDIEKLQKLEKDFPKLMVCPNKDNLDAILQAIELVKSDDDEDVVKIEEICKKLPYGLEGFKFIKEIF